MSMDTARLRQIAQSIAEAHIKDAEFSIVYEDEDLIDATDAEWRFVHDLITRAKVVLPS